jgi:cytochrome oxidase Cu insertion factor (SCO1/SenC/PrrC family)
MVNMNRVGVFSFKHCGARAGALMLTLMFACEAMAQNLFAGNARWIDDTSRAFELQTLQGTPTVITLAYGACRRICSTSLKVMREVQALADARHLALNFVVVGLDPASDTPADWAEFRHMNKLERPNWRFLTGTSEQVRLMAKSLGVRYWTYDGHTMHDFKIALLSPEGDLVRAIERFDQPAAGLMP